MIAFRPRWNREKMSEAGKILVAEDNDFVRHQIVRYLEGGGYNVCAADSGDGALSELGPDIKLAIVDVRMDPVGGFEFIKAMHGRNFYIPVILVTGDKTPDLLHEAGKLDVAAVLMKPVQKDRLLKAIGKILETLGRKSC